MWRTRTSAEWLGPLSAVRVSRHMRGDFVRTLNTAVLACLLAGSQVQAGVYVTSVARSAYTSVGGAPTVRADATGYGNTSVQSESAVIPFVGGHFPDVPAMGSFTVYSRANASLLDSGATEVDSLSPSLMNQVLVTGVNDVSAPQPTAPIGRSFSSVSVSVYLPGDYWVRMDAGATAYALGSNGSNLGYIDGPLRAANDSTSFLYRAEWGGVLTFTFGLSTDWGSLSTRPFYGGGTQSFVGGVTFIPVPSPGCGLALLAGGAAGVVRRRRAD